MTVIIEDRGPNVGFKRAERSVEGNGVYYRYSWTQNQVPIGERIGKLCPKQVDARSKN